MPDGVSSDDTVFDYDARAEQIERLKQRRTQQRSGAIEPDAASELALPAERATSLLVFAAFFGVLLAKLLVARFAIVGSAGPTSALLVEAVFVLALMAPVEFFVPRRVVGYLVLDGVLSLLLAASVVYASFFDRVLALDAIRLAGQLGDVQASVLTLLRPWHLLFFADIIAIGGLTIVRRSAEDAWWRARGGSNSARLAASHALVAAVVLVAVLVGDLGVGSTTGLARQHGLLRYQIAGLFGGGGTGDDSLVAAADPADPDAVQQAAWGIKGIDGTSHFDMTGVASGHNLIVIQIESMQQFAREAVVDGEEVTPVMNALAREGWDFSSAYFQVGIGNTSDAEFMFNTSLYPRDDVASGERIAGAEIPSLPRVLAEEGYESVAFHANEIEFWNRDVEYPALGFDSFYDVEHFGQEDVVGIGPSDEVLFAESMPVLEGLASRNTPFYAYFITLTPHHPFELPADKKRLELPADYEGTLVGRYLQSMNYDDWAIGQFIEQLKDAGLYEDSVIVIFGDHFGIDPLTIEPADEAVLEDILGRPYSVVDKMNIPFLVHVPGVEGEPVQRTVGEIDMLPTVADLMGLDTSGLVMFGKSAFDPSPNLLGARYYLPTGSFINEEVALVPETGYEDATAYDLDAGTPTDGSGATQDEFDRVLRLLSLSDAYVDALLAEQR